MNEKSHVGMFNCYFCGEPMGVLLDRQLRKSLPTNCGAIDMTPCHKCKDYMSQGIILISIKDDTKEAAMKGSLPNPYRTGGWCVVKDHVVENFRPKSFADFALKHRFMFITDSAWELMKLPKEGREE